MVLGKYHDVTHKDGKVCVRDRYVLRRLTEKIKVDDEVVKKFSLLASPYHFHPDDLEKVFFKYLFRVETMVGNEVSRHLVEEVLARGVDRLESLRQIKQDSKQQIKMGGVEGSNQKLVQTTEVTGTSNKRSRVSKKTKKKYRRKKKRW